MNQTEQILLKQIKELEARCAVANRNYQSANNQIQRAMQHALAPQVDKSARDLETDLNRVGKNLLMPGNVGDINKVIWGFWFTARDENNQPVIIAPGGVEKGSFSVTQEAAFVVTSHTAEVFIEDDQAPGEFSYVDPQQDDNAAKVDDLFYTFRDSQSSRLFHGEPQHISFAGNWKRPKKLSTPMLLMANSNFEVEYTNSDADNTYAVFMTFHGYRVRIDHAREMLGTVEA